MIETRLLEYDPTSIEGSFRLLTDVLMPLYNEYWQTICKPLYDVEFSPKAEAFMSIWATGIGKVLIAYRDDKPVGFLVGTVYRPMQFDATVLHVQDYYCDHDNEVMHSLFTKLDEIARILSCTEIWFEKCDHDVRPMINSSWRAKNIIEMTRFTR